MKRILVIFLIPFLYLSCVKEYEDIGDPMLVADGIVGQWQVNTVEVEDLLTIEERKGDVSEFYLSETGMASQISFSEENGERTFSLQWTMGKNYITGPEDNAPTTGNWDLDEEYQTTQVLLLDNNGQLINTLRLGAAVRPYSEYLDLASDQFCGEEAVHAYLFKFQRIDN